jgi:hypothetical protein
MKLYVWEHVLTDYTDGMVCVLANDEEEAWKLLYKKDDTAWWVLQGRPHIEEKGDLSVSAMKFLKEQKKFKLDSATSPKEVTEPEAFVVWGGS